MVNYMNHQTAEAIHEVFPCPRLAIQTALQEMAIYLGEDHDCSPDVFFAWPANLCPKNVYPPGMALIF